MDNIQRKDVNIIMPNAHSKVREDTQDMRNTWESIDYAKGMTMESNLQVSVSSIAM